MVQIVGVVIAVIGLAIGILKDYQSGNIRIPQIAQTSQKEQITQPVRFQYQYCLMCYDPNLEKVFYQHADGSWRDYAPQQQKIPIFN